MTQPKLTARIEALLASGFVVFAFLSAFFHVSDVDVGYHMRTAEHILTTHSIPATNTFSYTIPDHPWLLQQWLGTLVFYAAFHWGGIVGLVTFKSFLASALLLMVWLAGRRLTGPGSLWPLWTATLAVLLARIRFFERPDLLSGFLFAAVFVADLRFGNSRRWQWLGLPIFMALWANVHSGVIYGVGLLFARGAAEWIEWIFNSHRKSASLVTAENVVAHGPPRELWVRPVGILFALALACLVVQLTNPNGWWVLTVPISQFLSPFWQSVILEYHSPGWSDYKLFHLSLLGMLVLQFLTLRQVQWRLLLATVGFSFLAWKSQRSILFYSLAAMPHAAFMLHKLEFSPRLNESRISIALLPITWLVVVLTSFLPDRSYVFGPGLYRPYYPLEIYDFIKREVAPQHLFNEMRFGGSMQWWLYPDFKPFVDGRGDAYPEEFWKSDYLPVLALDPGWENILRKYGVHGVLLPILEGQIIPQLARRLHEHPEWALVAFNDDTLLFLERVPINQDVIARHEYRHLWPGDWSLGALNTPSIRTAASEEAQRAFELSPDSLFARTAMARVAFVNEQFDRAADLLNRIIREQDVGEAYHRDLGYALFRCNRLDEADKTFARMIRRKMLPGFANYMRYFIALGRGQVEQARKFLDRAIQLEPANSEYLDARKRFDTPATRP